MRALRLLPALLLLACAGARAKGPISAFAEAGVTERAAKPRRFALLVGIDSFQDERFGALRFARADALALEKGLFGFDEIKVLSSPEQTTRTALLLALDELARRATDPMDTVLIYFSTHGSLARPAGRPLQRYIVAHDTRMHLLSETGLSVDRLIEKVSNIPSRRKALILAMCHSGRGKSRVDDALSRALALQKAPIAPLEQVSEAVVVTTASAFGEVAQESDKLGHDIYTYFLLQALTKGDRNQDGAVTISEAHDWARERTYAFSGGQQRPTSQSDILGKDPIILAGERSRVGDPVIYSYAPSAENVAVWIDGRKKGVLPGGVAIEPGERKLSLRDEQSGGLLYEGRVQLERGQTQELSALLTVQRPQLYASLLGTTSIPLGAARGRFLPPSFGGGARLGFRGWPLAGLELALSFSHGRGRGEAPGLDEQLPYSFESNALVLQLGYALGLFERIALIPSLQAGLLWAARILQSEGFEGREQLRGLSLGGQVALVWKPGFGALLGAAVSAQALIARLGEQRGPHPMLGIELFAGYAFF